MADIMADIAPDWIGGPGQRITLKWVYLPVAIIRGHRTDKIPGPVNWSCIAVCKLEGGYEYQLLNKADGGKAPTGDDYRSVSKYLNWKVRHFGGHRRFREDRLPKGVGIFKTVVERGNSAQNKNGERNKMADAKLRIKMEYLEDGVVASDTVVSFYTMEYDKIVATQKAVANAITGLGDFAVAAKAADPVAPAA